jgi:O-acetyl-ADP-ribose deacetylase (regulator of RNase III)
MNNTLQIETGYFERDGDLIELAEAGEFDVVAHGCNCFCTMGNGIAPQMAEAFGCDNFTLESAIYEGNINKLGQINYETFAIRDDGKIVFDKPQYKGKKLSVVNAYTQYDFKHHKSQINLDYEALTLCMRKIAHTFEGSHVGLPKIGCGLAGGDWDQVRQIIIKELSKKCKVTIVNYVK